MKNCIGLVKERSRAVPVKTVERGTPAPLFLLRVNFCAGLFINLNYMTIIFQGFNDFFCNGLSIPFITYK